MRAPHRIAALVVVFCFFASSRLRAQAPETHAQVQLIAEEGTYRPAGTLWVGVLFHLDPGWHVYWQNPGDSGTPPKIEWTVPRGFHAGTVRWPRPIRLGKGSVIDYGYEGQLLLMAPVVVSANAIGPATIDADVEYVVCREICIPANAQLTLSLPQSPPRIEHFSDSRPLFQSTRQQFPNRPPSAWNIAAQATKNTFQLAIRGPGPKQNVFFFPLDPGVIDNAAPQTLSATAGGFTLTLAKSELLTRPPRLLRGVLDIPGTGVFDISVPVATVAPATR